MLLLYTGSCGSAAVVLDIPLLPVMEGDDVTLGCVTAAPSSNASADFYKDDVLIRSSPTGNMSILGASASDEGLYKCRIPGAGESPAAWLNVRGETNTNSSGEAKPGDIRSKSCG